MITNTQLFDIGARIEKEVNSESLTRLLYIYIRKEGHNIKIFFFVLSVLYSKNYDRNKSSLTEIMHDGG
jgi:hypothetical protein